MSGAPPTRSAGVVWPRLVRRYGVGLALALLVCAVAIKSPAFLNTANLLNILGQWTPVGIMAVGMTYVIIVGGFDLSVAPGFGLCAVVAAILGRAGWSPALAFAGSLGVGALIGALNALLVCGLVINPFIATLGVGFILSSMPFVIVENPYIQVETDGFDALGTGSLVGLPYSGLLLAAFFVVGGIVLSRTAYGQWIYAIGGNRQASRLVGIRVDAVTASTYVFSGMCMAIAADVSTSQLSYSASEQDPSLMFDVIVSVIVGGTSLEGGFGSMSRTAAGLAILATLQNGLNLLEVSTFAQYIVKGCIIVIALGLDVLSRWLANVGERRAQHRPRRTQAPGNTPLVVS